MQFKTRYGQAIVRVLQAYPVGTKSLIVSLEAIVQTAMDRTQTNSREQVAQDVCEGFHPGPANGLICKACYDAVVQQKMPQADMMMGEDTPEDKKETKDVEDFVKQIIGYPDLDIPGSMEEP